MEALVWKKRIKRIVKISETGKRVIKQETLPREMREPEELTPETIRQTVTGIQKAIRENYVFPEQAKDLCRILEAHHASGDYDQIIEPRTFCKQLTHHLQNVVNDKHLQVMLPSDMPNIVAHVMKGPSGINETVHSDLTNTKILPDNIGYINIPMFNLLSDSANRIEEVMQSVKNIDALIIDLRKCCGGSADSANFLLSYFFNSEAPVTLLETYFRPQNEVFQCQTTETLFKYTKPIYALTSGFTGSCGEHFAFALKIHRKATLVGESTAGLAHPVALIGLDAGFLLKVPIGRTYDPETGED